MALAAIIGAVTAADAVTKAVKDIYGTLDGARSCVITIKNHTNQQFEIAGEGHESGGYKVPPNQFLNAKEFQVFGAQDKGFMTGAIGHITYRATPFDPNAVTGEWFYIRWANPFSGANAASSNIYTIAIGSDNLGLPREWDTPSTKYRSSARAGSGEVGAEMLFELYDNSGF